MRPGAAEAVGISLIPHASALSTQHANPPPLEWLLSARSDTRNVSAGQIMGRYIQRISLRPFAETEMWIGWYLEGLTGPVDGLTEADGLSAADLERYGVCEFQAIPREYLIAIRDELRGTGSEMRVLVPVTPRSSRTYT